MTAAVACLLLTGTAACSGDGSSDGADASPSPSASGSALNAGQVVAGLTGAGYKCGDDTPYAICSSGPVAVWVLTGKHPRPPIISVHAAGQAAPATAAIAKDLPSALQLAGVPERTQIVDWFGQQTGKPSAQTTVGDWRIEWSAEVDTEEPSAQLTLVDTLCKESCQTE